MNAHDDQPRRAARHDNRALSPQAFESASLALFASALRRSAACKPLPVPALAPVKSARPRTVADLRPTMLTSEWRDPLAWRLCWTQRNRPAQGLNSA